MSIEDLRNVLFSSEAIAPDPLNEIIDNAQPDELETLLPQFSYRHLRALENRIEYLYMSTEIEKHRRIAYAQELCEYHIMISILDDPDAPKPLRQRALRFAEQIKKLNLRAARRTPEEDDERGCIVENGETLFADEIFF